MFAILRSHHFEMARVEGELALLVFTSRWRLKALGSIPTAPTKLLQFITFVFGFDTISAFDTN
jgi:hypothetical protein